MNKNLLLILLLFAGCTASNPAKLSRLHIVDRNGLTETISNEERLKKFERVDFMQGQSYEKVLRIYKADKKDGKVRGYLTSYHPNGSLYQYLELVNSRACGAYREWHPSGKLKIEATVVGGMGDLTESAKKTWLFSGPSKVFDEGGEKEAEFFYVNGKLDGEALYFQGKEVIGRIPYKEGVIDGEYLTYYPGGNLVSKSAFSKGKQDGETLTYFKDGSLAAKEYFEGNLLVSGSYFDPEGALLSAVEGGKGTRALYSKGHLFQLQTHEEGVIKGKIEELSEQGHLKRTFSLVEGAKSGEEIEYYLPGPFSPKCDTPNKKLSISWVNGKITGEVKTWYANGKLESRREFSNNKKQGLSTAWYESGEVMLIEEYDKDKLLSGKYFEKGAKSPISEVLNGKGSVTLFDSSGNLKKKVAYESGLPQV